MLKHCLDTTTQHTQAAHWLNIGNIFVHISETNTLFFVLNINGETITAFNISNNKIVLVYVKKTISFTTSYLKIL